MIGAIWSEYLYYNSFGIDIFSYITFSEIITLFLGSIPSLTLIALVVLFVTFILSDVSKNTIEKLTSPRKSIYMKRKRIVGRFDLLIVMVSFLLIFGPLMLPIREAFTTFIKSETYFAMRLVGVFIFFAFFLKDLVPFLGSQFNFKKIYLYFIIFIVIFFGAIYFKTSHKLWSVRNDPHQYFLATTLVLKDSTTINTNDSLIFIGQTNNYVFLYRFTPQLDSSYTTVISIDQIKTIKIQKYVAWGRLP